MVSKNMTRREMVACVGAAATSANAQPVIIETVGGRLPVERLGVTLIHEHILVDFVGAAEVSPQRYNADEVYRTALPKLRELRQRGCQTLVECTPAYLGRDPRLLRRLSGGSGLIILTNTGYYGAAKDKHVPAHAYKESAEQLAARWTAEAQKGIDGTGIRPAFQKIGVDAGPLSDIDRKLVTAGAQCHKQTGLRLHVHTGDGRAAMEILDLLAKEGAPASAYVWVHAQNEKDRQMHLQAARAGAWVEFDGVRPRSLELHRDAVLDLAKADLLGNVLVSQDSGWYRVGEPGGGQFNGYTFLFDEFLPALKSRGMNDKEIQQLMVQNPAKVLTR
jgi:phosphotriesterase-related protein